MSAANILKKLFCGLVVLGITFGATITIAASVDCPDCPPEKDGSIFPGGSCKNCNQDNEVLDKDGNLVFVTKGDNNANIDDEKVTEEQILAISKKYYEEIQEVEGECKVSNEYAYCLLGALYYLINYFLLIEDSIKESLLNILSCLFEDLLVDFSEELMNLINEDFIEVTLELLGKEING